MNPKRISKCRNISAAVTWSNKDVSVSFVDMGGVVGVYLCMWTVSILRITSISHASVLLLTMNFVITSSK